MIAKKHKVERNLINSILKKGKSKTSKLFIIRYSENRQEYSRYCTIISRKVSLSAVERNKKRRQIYEAIRIISEETPPQTNIDLILIPKKQILSATYQEIEKDIREIINTHG